ncbi:MAG: TolC family protein [Bacteroidota bacterium]
MKKLTTLLIALSLCLSLTAQEKLSLAQAIEMGIQNNYQIEIAQQNLQIASNNNVWGAAGRYPNVDFNVNSANGYRNARAPGFLLEQSSLSAGITLFPS